jgi:hypothetical protein
MLDRTATLLARKHRRCSPGNRGGSRRADLSEPENAIAVPASLTPVSPETAGGF